MHPLLRPPATHRGHPSSRAKCGRGMSCFARQILCPPATQCLQSTRYRCVGSHVRQGVRGRGQLALSDACCLSLVALRRGRATSGGHAELLGGIIAVWLTKMHPRTAIWDSGAGVYERASKQPFSLPIPSPAVDPLEYHRYVVLHRRSHEYY